MLCKVDKIRVRWKWWQFWKRRTLKPGKDYTISDNQINFKSTFPKDIELIIDYSAPEGGGE